MQNFVLHFAHSLVVIEVGIWDIEFGKRNQLRRGRAELVFAFLRAIHYTSSRTKFVNKDKESTVEIVYAHEDPQSPGASSIFLAGPSPRNADDYNWRPEALGILSILRFRGTVYVPLPRDGNWLADYEAQVDWELRFLHMSMVIAFWIPRELTTLPGFTTNVEFGMFVASGKIVLGYPAAAPKMRYLAHLARLYNVPVHNDLTVTLAQALVKTQEAKR